jgi:hypothetical protein
LQPAVGFLDYRRSTLISFGSAVASPSTKILRLQDIDVILKVEIGRTSVDSPPGAATWKHLWQGALRPEAIMLRDYLAVLRILILRVAVDERITARSPCFTHHCTSYC